MLYKSQVIGIAFVGGFAYYTCEASVAAALQDQQADLIPAKGVQILAQSSGSGTIAMSRAVVLNNPIPYFTDTVQDQEFPGVANDRRPALPISPRDLLQNRLGSTLGLSGDIYRGVDINGLPLRFFVDT